MQPSQNLFEAIAVVLDDADYARQRRRFPRVEVVQQAIR
jgi:hypothetical protein